MSKIIHFIYLIAGICFVCCFIKTFNTFNKITTDVDESVYISLGNKEYDKDIVIKYFKQIFRYIIYFIYFYDIENMDTVRIWKK